MRKTAKNPTKERIDEILSYSPEDGKLRWKERPRSSFKNESLFKSWNARFSGSEAGCRTNRNGKTYLLVRVDNVLFYAHRIIWIILNGGIDSSMEIDHINGDGLDNRAVNLRLVSKRENNKNKRLQENNTSGFNGVSFDKKVGKWHAYVKINRKRRTLGYFSLKSDAIKAREDANRKLKFHSNHGAERPL